jgi:membrane glycosyltransferase
MEGFFLVILFIAGLFCFLIVLGLITKQILGLQWDDKFVPDFVYKGIVYIGRGVVVLLALSFVWLSLGIIQEVF